MDWWIRETGLIALDDRSSKDKIDDIDIKHDQKASSWATVECFMRVPVFVPDVLGVEWIALIGFSFKEIIFYELKIGEKPVSKCKEENWSLIEVKENRIVQFLIICRWLLENVVNHEFFEAKEASEWNCGDWEKNRHTCSKHHCDKNNIHDTGVLIMHVILWTSMKVYVLLNACRLGAFVFRSTAIVEDSES